MITKQQHDEWKKDLIELHSLRVKNKQLRKALEAKIEQLKTYCRHESWCEANEPLLNSTCNCGLEQALKTK